MTGRRGRKGWSCLDRFCGAVSADKVGKTPLFGPKPTTESADFSDCSAGKFRRASAHESDCSQGSDTRSADSAALVGFPTPQKNSGQSDRRLSLRFARNGDQSLGERPVIMYRPTDLWSRVVRVFLMDRHNSPAEHFESAVRPLSVFHLWKSVAKI